MGKLKLRVWVSASAFLLVSSCLMIKAAPVVICRAVEREGKRGEFAPWPQGQGRLSNEY